jgi:hypothetical protein
MFKKLKNTRVNEIKKFLGMTYCVEQVRFCEEDEAMAYFSEMQEKYPSDIYDVYVQCRLAFDTWQVVVLKKGWA